MRGVFCETPGLLAILMDCLHGSREEAEEALRLIQLALLADPEVGDVIQGTGGCRKLRWRARGHGKRGGLRVIYPYVAEYNRFLLLGAYPKNEKEDLTTEDRRLMEKAANAYREALRARNG